MKKIRLNLYRFKRKLIKSFKSVYYWRDKVPYFLGIKKAVKGSMPDFIIAGLPKCGTSWLVEALNSNHNFMYIKNPFFDHKGEIRFFSKNFNQPISKYLEAFRKERMDKGRLLFEKSPDYSRMHISRLKLIKRLNPQIKIILLFRDPVERAFSNAKMDLIRNRGINLKPENDHYFLKSYKGQLIKHNYQRVLNRWHSVFDKSQILILSMEDVKEHPIKVLEKTHAFLGVNFSNNYTGLQERKNVTLSKPIPNSHLVYLKKHLSETIDYWENNQDLFRLE